jgi:hypothetical protein
VKDFSVLGSHFRIKNIYDFIVQREVEDVHLVPA